MILLLYGSGGTGKEALYVAECINSKRKRWEKIIFIDDIAPPGEKYGYKSYGFDYVRKNIAPTEAEVCITIGEPDLRRVLWNKVEAAAYSFTSLVHPQAIIMDRVIIGTSVVIKAGATVSCDAVIEDNVCINSQCVIGHDVVIKRHSFMAAQSMVAAKSVVEEGVFIGLQAGIREGLHIGENAIVSMGACVMRDVPNDMIVMGNPARVIQKNEEKRVFK